MHGCGTSPTHIPRSGSLSPGIKKKKVFIWGRLKGNKGAVLGDRLCLVCLGECMKSDICSRVVAWVGGVILREPFL